MLRSALWLSVALPMALGCSDDEDDHLGGVPANKELGNLTAEEATSFCEANATNLVAAQRGACIRAAQIVAPTDTAECQRISGECRDNSSFGVDCAQWNPTRLSACTTTAEQYKTCIGLLADNASKLSCGASPPPLPGCLNLLPAECPVPQANTAANP